MQELPRAPFVRCTIHGVQHFGQSQFPVFHRPTLHFQALCLSGRPAPQHGRCQACVPGQARAMLTPWSARQHLWVVVAGHLTSLSPRRLGFQHGCFWIHAYVCDVSTCSRCHLRGGSRRSCPAQTCRSPGPARRDDAETSGTRLWQPAFAQRMGGSETELQHSKELCKNLLSQHGNLTQPNLT